MCSFRLTLSLLGTGGLEAGPAAVSAWRPVRACLADHCSAPVSVRLGRCPERPGQAPGDCCPRRVSSSRFCVSMILSFSY